jgi:hypothetical protein
VPTNPSLGRLDHTETLTQGLSVVSCHTLSQYGITHPLVRTPPIRIPPLRNGENVIRDAGGVLARLCRHLPRDIRSYDPSHSPTELRGIPTSAASRPPSLLTYARLPPSSPANATTTASRPPAVASRILLTKRAISLQSVKVNYYRLSYTLSAVRAL